jgi:hypothetical protein
MASLNPDPYDGQRRTTATQPAIPAGLGNSAEIAEHATERWDRFTIAADQQSDVSRRSFKIIAAVMAAGVLAWLLLTA